MIQHSYHTGAVGSIVEAFAQNPVKEVDHCVIIIYDKPWPMHIYDVDN